MNKTNILRTSDEDLLIQTLKEMADNLAIDNLVQSGDELNISIRYDSNLKNQVCAMLVSKLLEVCDEEMPMENVRVTEDDVVVEKDEDESKNSLYYHLLTHMHEWSNITLDKDAKIHVTPMDNEISTVPPQYDVSALLDSVEQNRKKIQLRKKNTLKRVADSQKVLETVSVEVLVLLNTRPTRNFDDTIETNWVVFDSYCPLLMDDDQVKFSMEKLTLNRRQLELLAITNIALRIDGNIYALSEHGYLSLARKIAAVTALPMNATVDERISAGLMLSTKLSNFPSLSLMVQNSSGQIQLIQGVAEKRYQTIRQDDLLVKVLEKAIDTFPNAMIKVLGAEVSTAHTLIDLSIESMEVNDLKMGIRLQNSDLGDQAISLTLTGTMDGAVGYLITNKQRHMCELDDKLIEKLFAGFKEQYNTLVFSKSKSVTISKQMLEELSVILGKKRIKELKIHAGNMPDIYKKLSNITANGKWKWRLGNAIGQILLDNQQAVLEKEA